MASKEYILHQEEQSSRKIDPIGHLAAVATDGDSGAPDFEFHATYDPF